jgi:hypothetical protein
MQIMTTYTPKEIAVKLGTDPKTLRKFLRSDASGVADQAPGKGSRWSIEANAVRGMKSRFTKWDATRREEIARRAAERAEVARNAADAPEGDGDEVEELETLED